MSEFTTPADLARDLLVSQRRIREFLRSEFGKLVAPERRWQLDEARVAKVLAHFRSKS